MDGKERGWGGFFRGEKHVNQRTIKIRQPLTRSQHSWLSERVYPYLEQVVKTRNLCPLPRTKPNTQQSLLTTENLPQQFFHFFINYRHNPAPLTPARLLFTDSEVNQNIISTLFSHRFVAVRGGKKKEISRVIMYSLEVKTQPSSARAFCARSLHSPGTGATSRGPGRCWLLPAPCWAPAPYTDLWPLGHNLPAKWSSAAPPFSHCGMQATCQ